MKPKTEKIEVAKNNGNFYYTGILKEDPDNPGWVLINTTRGEKLKFRKEQIMQRRAIDTQGADTHERSKEGNKNI
jgi:hypothetical protein